MLIFDTETTGFLLPGQPLANQPHIIEIGMIKTDGQLNELARFQRLLCPGKMLEPIITEITGITDADLEGCPRFARVVADLADFCRGEKECVAHNVEFDRSMLVNELLRIDWQWRFPFPSFWIDTVPLSGGKKLDVWSKEILGDSYTPQTHRALGDCERLLACYRAYNGLR